MQRVLGSILSTGVVRKEKKMEKIREEREKGRKGGLPSLNS